MLVVYSTQRLKEDDTATTTLSLPYHYTRLSDKNSICQLCTSGVVDFICFLSIINSDM